MMSDTNPTPNMPDTIPFPNMCDKNPIPVLSDTIPFSNMSDTNPIPVMSDTNPIPVMSDTNPIPNMSDPMVSDATETNLVIGNSDKIPISDISFKSANADVCEKSGAISEFANMCEMETEDVSSDSLELSPENTSQLDSGSEMPETNFVTEMSERLNDSPGTNISHKSESSSSADMSEEEYVSMIPEIPNLDFSTDKELLLAPTDGDKIELVGFDLQPYSLCDSERYGSCRLISDFEKLSYVGEGAYGIVYKVLDKKYDTILALKKMKISMDDDECATTAVIHEVNILKQLDHPNIVNLKGTAVGRNFDTSYLILDYCEYDLSKVIDDEKSCSMLQEPQIKCIMLQLFESLKYIHENNIIHRDISCSNVLFTSDGVLKVGDFGLARCMDVMASMTPHVVSRWYRAPEILLGSTKYNFAIDIWSAGCILGELLLRKPLFKADTDMAMIAGIIDLLGTPTEDNWPGLSELPVMKEFELEMQTENNFKIVFDQESEECLDLLSKLFIYDPQSRISASTAFGHTYFSTDPCACSPEDLVTVLKVTDEINAGNE